jgi:hypothetical protein
MHKQILKLLHNFELCPNLCNIKYPWSWRSKLSNKNLKYLKYSICSNFKSDDNREYFDDSNFKKYSAEAYKIIYNTYLEKKDFLDYCYATPSLSIALNNLRSTANINKLSKNINIKNSKIIDLWYEYGLTKSNDKILGFYSKDEIFYEFIAGSLGPEVRKFWDQQSIKQKVKILYESDDYCDVLEWERNMMIPDQDWQVSNINEILI